MKDYLYLAGIGLLLGLVFAVYRAGENKILSQNKVIAQAAVQHIADAQTIAVLNLKKAGETHDENANRPVTDAPVARLCGSPRKGKLPAATEGTVAVAGNTSPPIIGSGNSGDLVAGPDVGKPLVELTRKDDADVAYLLAYIDQLEALMLAGK